MFNATDNNHTGTDEYELCQIMNSLFENPSETYGIVRDVYYYIILIFSVIINFCFVLGFIATKQYTKRSDRCFIILSFLDFSICFFYLIEKIATPTLKSEICLTQFLVSSAFVHLSINLFFFILVDRYIFVTYNQFHERNGVIIMKVSCVLILSYSLIAAGLLTYSFLTNDKSSLIILNIMTVVQLSLIVFLSIIFNIHLIVYIKISERNVSTTGNANTNTNHKKATYTLVTISCVLVVCYSCFIITSVYNTITFHNASELNIVVTWISLLLFVNSALNSGIYMFRNDEVKRFYVRSLQKLLNK